MMLAIASLVAGLLSVLAPCVLPMIPILLARTAGGERQRSPWWVIGGLAVSITLFSIVLKSTTLLIDVEASVWAAISGAIIIAVGITMALPQLWERVSERWNLRAQHGLAEASRHRGRLGDILLGASLGPVFSACSPTYLLIVAVILPAQPIEGLLYLLIFVSGLVGGLALIARLGSSMITRLGWGLDPNGTFRRAVGIALIFFGLLILTGLDKIILAWLVTNGWFDWQVALESLLAQ